MQDQTSGKLAVRLARLVLVLGLVVVPGAVYAAEVEIGITVRADRVDRSPLTTELRPGDTIRWTSRAVNAGDAAKVRITLTAVGGNPFAGGVNYDSGSVNIGAAINPSPAIRAEAATAIPNTYRYEIRVFKNDDSEIAALRETRSFVWVPDTRDGNRRVRGLFISGPDERRFDRDVDHLRDVIDDGTTRFATNWANSPADARRAQVVVQGKDTVSQAGATDRTVAQIVADIAAAFAGADDDDVSVFVFSGHGDKRHDGDEPPNDFAAFCDVLDCDEVIRGQTVLDADDAATRQAKLPADDDFGRGAIGQALARVRGTKILIFASCFSGGLMDGRDDLPIANSIVITAVTNDETSLADELLDIAAHAHTLFLGVTISGFLPAGNATLSVEARPGAVTAHPTTVAVGSRVTWRSSALLDPNAAQIQVVFGGREPFGAPFDSGRVAIGTDIISPVVVAAAATATPNRFTYTISVYDAGGARIATSNTPSITAVQAGVAQADTDQDGSIAAQELFNFALAQDQNGLIKKKNRTVGGRRVARPDRTETPQLLDASAGGAARTVLFTYRRGTLSGHIHRDPVVESASVESTNCGCNPENIFFAESSSEGLTVTPDLSQCFLEQGVKFENSAASISGVTVNFDASRSSPVPPDFSFVPRLLAPSESVAIPTRNLDSGIYVFTLNNAVETRDPALVIASRRSAESSVRTSVTGSASRVGLLPPPGSAGSAQVRLSTRFTFTEPIDLSASTVTITRLLGELGPGGSGELVRGTNGVEILPITLTARAGSTPNAAIFVSPSGAIPSFRLEVKNRGGGLFDLLLRVDKATIPAFPALCEGNVPTTDLSASFVIDDGANPPMVLSITEPWRCLDLIGGDPDKPRSLRTP